MWMICALKWVNVYNVLSNLTGKKTNTDQVTDGSWRFSCSSNFSEKIIYTDNPIVKYSFLAVWAPKSKLLFAVTNQTLRFEQVY